MSSFSKEVADRLTANSSNGRLRFAAREFMDASFEAKYSYNLSWLGRPIIQYPQDVVAVQEIIWGVRPDLIIETGIAHGGSLIMSASMLALLDLCDAIDTGRTFDPRISNRLVVGVDIDIRQHNRQAIEQHPLASRIQMVQGSSIAPEIVDQVRTVADGFRRILVFLDSNHTHEHVLAELEAYGPLVTSDSYCCVFDTVVDDLPDAAFADRPWGPGDNPKTAVNEYLRLLKDEGRKANDGNKLKFEIDWSFDHKLMISVAPGGYLKRL